MPPSNELASERASGDKQDPAASFDGKVFVRGKVMSDTEGLSDVFKLGNTSHTREELLRWCLQSLRECSSARQGWKCLLFKLQR